MTAGPSEKRPASAAARLAVASDHDAAPAALVARNLSRILDVSEVQASLFVEAGDQKAVRRLQRALETLPGAEPAASLTALASTAPAAALPPGLRARLRGLSTLKSCYGEDFGGRDQQRRRAASLQALKSLVRQEHAGHLEAWQESANQRDLDVLADACRCLRSAGAKRASTAYGKMCVERCDSAAAAAAAKASPDPHLRRRNLRNYSVGVPLGGIYKEPDREVLRAQADLTAKVLEAARAQEDGLRAGADAGASMGLPCYAARDLVSSANVGKGCFVHPDRPGNTKSLSQASYHVGVHKKGNAEMYGHKFVKAGEKAWRDCKHDAAWELGVYDWPQPLSVSRSTPQLRCQ